jgi:hypothetical protein
MDAPPPGFIRVVLACACGQVDVCDVRLGAMSPERLRAGWVCFGCGEREEPPRTPGATSGPVTR